MTEVAEAGSWQPSQMAGLLGSPTVMAMYFSPSSDLGRIAAVAPSWMGAYCLPMLTNTVAVWVGLAKLLLPLSAGGFSSATTSLTVPTLTPPKKTSLPVISPFAFWKWMLTS